MFYVCLHSELGRSKSQSKKAVPCLKSKSKIWLIDWLFALFYTSWCKRSPLNSVQYFVHKYLPLQRCLCSATQSCANTPWFSPGCDIMGKSAYIVFFKQCIFCFYFCSLKYLNASANALENIPPSSQSEESLSTLQELYLTGNNLNENCGALLVGHQNLRVLHIAYNQLLSFPARCVTWTLSQSF